MDDNEESIFSLARTISSYEKLIELDENKFEGILRLITKQKIIKIANDCVSNLEKNILKNYSLLINIDIVCPFKDNKILDSKQLEEIFHIFKKEFLEYKIKYEKSIFSESNLHNKEESKNNNLNVLPQSEQIEKRLEFLKFIIKILTEFKQYDNLKEILMEDLLLNKEQKRLFINQFIDKFKEKREYWLNKEEINFYELLILEFNYLENNLEY